MYKSQRYIALSLLAPRAKVVLLRVVCELEVRLQAFLDSEVNAGGWSAASSLDEGPRHSVDKKIGGHQNPSRRCVGEGERYLCYRREQNPDATSQVVHLVALSQH